MSGVVLIWGAGGHGKVVADLVRAGGLTLAGFIDRDSTKQGAMVEPGGGRTVMSEHELRAALGGSAPWLLDVDAVTLGIGDNHARMDCVGLLGEHLAAALVHPRATVSASAMVGAGTVILAGAVVNAAATVGGAVIINSGAIIEHDCVIEDGAHISSNAILAGGVRVKSCALIGAGATILPGISVGSNAIIGAGAVVTRDVLPDTTVVGNPARRLIKA